MKLARLFALPLALAAAACAARRAPEPAKEEAVPPARSAEADRLVSIFPDVTLLLEDGTPLRFYEDVLRGKNVIVSFTYTTCTGSCVGTNERLGEVRDALGDRVGRDVFIYSVSLDPEADTPAVLREFAAAHGAGPGTGWRFLTGSKDGVERVRRSLGVEDPDPVVDADRTQHAAILVFGSEPLGKWSSIATRAPKEEILRSFERVTRPPRRPAGAGTAR